MARTNMRVPPLWILLALLAGGCAGDRPSPIPDGQTWIQLSTHDVTFEQIAYQPETIAPAAAEVRLAFEGGEPGSQPWVDTQPGDALSTRLSVTMHADPAGWFVSIAPSYTAWLDAGVHTGTVQVWWSEASNAPALIEVSLVVRPPPGLWLPGQPSIAVRARHTTTALPDGGALVVGGGLAQTRVERLDAASGRWLDTGPLTHGRQEHTATLLPSGKVFIAGGRATASTDQAESTWEIYDPDGGLVETWGYLYQPRFGHSAVLLRDGRVLLVGGTMQGDPGTARVAEIFDPWTLQCAPVGALHGDAPSALPTALLSDGQVLVLNSTADGTQIGAEIFDPVTQAWTVGPPRAWPRRSGALVALAGGRALALGGEAEMGLVAPAELYDPQAGAWVPAGTLFTTHSGIRDATVLLPSGRVLVAGGLTFGGGQSTRVAEIFDPSSGEWSVAGALNWPRAYHTVTVLGDGRVIAVGGVTVPATSPLDRPELWREPPP